MLSAQTILLIGRLHTVFRNKIRTSSNWHTEALFCLYDALRCFEIPYCVDALELTTHPPTICHQNSYSGIILSVQAGDFNVAVCCIYLEHGNTSQSPWK